MSGHCTFPWSVVTMLLDGIPCFRNLLTRPYGTVQEHVVPPHEHTVKTPFRVGESNTTFVGWQLQLLECCTEVNGRFLVGCREYGSRCPLDLTDDYIVRFHNSGDVKEFGSLI